MSLERWFWDWDCWRPARRRHCRGAGRRVDVTLIPAGGIYFTEEAANRTSPALRQGMDLGAARAVLRPRPCNVYATSRDAPGASGGRTALHAVRRDASDRHGGHTSPETPVTSGTPGTLILCGWTGDLPPAVVRAATGTAPEMHTDVRPGGRPLEH